MPYCASAAAVVKSFVFEASGLGVSAAWAQTTSPDYASTTSRPLEEPPPAVSQAFIWAQEVAADALPASSRKSPRQTARAGRSAFLIVCTNTFGAQGSGGVGLIVDTGRALWVK